MQEQDLPRQQMTLGRALALTGLIIGFTVFAAGIGLGISTDPRVDMHGRMFCYAIGTVGLTVGSASRLALAEGQSDIAVWATSFVVAATLMIYQFGQLC